MSKEEWILAYKNSKTLIHIYAIIFEPRDVFGFSATHDIKKATVFDDFWAAYELTKERPLSKFKPILKNKI